MAHALIIGGQPDYFTLWRDENGEAQDWEAHGREITDGVDAEKTLDGTPSVRYRAESIGSGEYRFFGRRWSIGGGSPFIPVPSRGICGVVHNLLDVGGKVRHVVASSDIFGGLVYPDSTVASSNSTSIVTDVDQDPYSETPPSTFAGPTTTGDPWYLEVGFSNATVLNTATADSQQILVYLKWNGTYDGENTATVLIEVKEGATVRASKNLRIRATNGNTFITSVLVNPADFTDETLDGMSVRVTCGAAATAKYWQVATIAWIRQPASGILFDSGWDEVETPTNDLFIMSTEVQYCSVIPYLDANGNLSQQAGNFSYTFLYWDDSYDEMLIGRNRIFEPNIDANKSGELTGWRPEVGVIVEGPALGIDKLDYGSTFSIEPRDIVYLSKGGNRWTIRRESPRLLSISLSQQDADIVIPSLISVLRRAGQSRPMLISYRPDDDTLSSVMSLYGVVSWRATATERASDGDGMKNRFAVTLDVEEVL